MRWLGKEDDTLRFVVAPPTFRESKATWTLSDDGRYALSNGANVILWDVALGRPLVVYPGTATLSGEVRFSRFAPHLLYFQEASGFWSLRNLYTAEIKGFFRNDELPPANPAQPADEFFRKVSSAKTIFEFTDAAMDNSGTKIALGGVIPVLWDLADPEPRFLVPRSLGQWYDPILNHHILYRSPRSTDNFYPAYCNIRCIFGADSTIYLSQPAQGLYHFDMRGNLLNKFKTPGIITQLRRFRDFIITEIDDRSPLLLRPGRGELQPLISRRGNEPPFNTISEISDNGFFIGNVGSDLYFMAQLRADGTARWGRLEAFPGQGNGELQRIFLSPSAGRFSIISSFNNYIIQHRLEIDNDYPGHTSIIPKSNEFRRGMSGYSGAFINDSTFVAGTIYGQAFIGRADRFSVLNESATAHPLLNHNGAVIGVMSPDSTTFATADSFGTVRLFDSATYDLLMTMIIFPGSNDYIMYTPDNYYKATKGAVDKIFYVKGLDSFTFRQFDLKYNRPDIILERLKGDEDKIRILRAAWQKRLRHMGFTESDVASSRSHAPQLDITNRQNLPDKTDSGTITLDIAATDSLTTIQSIHVLVNDVPLYGSRGQEIERTRSYSASLDIPLGQGDNTVTVYCLNSFGQESLQHQIAVNNTRPAPEGRTLYIAAAGVSRYRNSGHDLRFAATDAATFAGALARDNSRFDNVRTMLLQDEDFSPASLPALQSFFNQSRPDDVAMLYYAGHGILDPDLNYYLGCSGTDFSRPDSTSVRFDDFRDILEAIPSLHRFCFVDACHSGDIDRDDALAVNVIPASEYGDLTFRTGGRQIISTANREIARQYHTMFVDLSHKSGITVVASSDGDELSVESDRYGGGLFTGIIKSALGGKCDADGDGAVTSSELLEYVTRTVSEISAGRQNPKVKYHDLDKTTILK